MVKPLPPKEALKAMEDGFPKTESLENKSLNLAEKARLAFYRRLFSRTKNKETGKMEIGHKSSFSTLDKILGFFGGNSNKKWAENMEEDFEALEKRNQNEMDRLIEMLKNNPDEALKYAIPINDGASRGPQEGQFTLSQRWNTFSLFGNNSGRGGGNFTSGRTNDLAAEYNRIAQELIRKKDFRKAAFIYHKLLKQPFLAAETLEKGEHYHEAAAIFLEFLKNKERAALCYEKGNMTESAITLYKELNKHEKVGDLYIKLNKRNDANQYYEKAADEHESKKQYVKASLIYREKMLKPESGQEMLLNGWRENCDAQNCMGVYFSNIQSDRARSEAYATFYTDEVDDDNRALFIAVAESEFKKHAVHAEQLKTLAYEAAVIEIPKNPAVVSGLSEFNKNDKQFTSDTIRFRNTNKPIVQPTQAAIPAPVTPPARREESFTVTEVMPSFPGGESAMRAYISANVRYPQYEKEQGKNGNVKVGFDVTRDGNVEKVETLQGVPGAPGLDREAERLVRAMPRWNPGTINGRRVRFTMNITVTFKLV
jgi:TonB family protein